MFTISSHSHYTALLVSQAITLAAPQGNTFTAFEISMPLLSVQRSMFVHRKCFILPACRAAQPRLFSYLNRGYAWRGLRTGQLGCCAASRAQHKWGGGRHVTARCEVTRPLLNIATGGERAGVRSRVPVYCSHFCHTHTPILPCSGSFLSSYHLWPAFSPPRRHSDVDVHETASNGGQAPCQMWELLIKSRNQKSNSFGGEAAVLQCTKQISPP